MLLRSYVGKVLTLPRDARGAALSGTLPPALFNNLALLQRLSVRGRTRRLNQLRADLCLPFHVQRVDSVRARAEYLFSREKAPHRIAPALRQPASEPLESLLLQMLKLAVQHEEAAEILTFL